METEIQNDIVQEETGTEQVNNQEAESGVNSTHGDYNNEQEASKKDKYAIDYREIRKSKEKAEKERDEAYKLIQKMKEKYPDKEENVDLPEIGDDDLVEGKHLGKVAQKIKSLEKQVQAYQQLSNVASVEAKLKSKYDDFDKVVSKENVEALADNYPELANTLRSTEDLYSQAVTAYTMIKQMGVYKEDVYSEDRARANYNASKPRPLASVSPQQGESPLTRANAFANGLTNDLKAQLLKEMNEARSRM